VVGRDFPSAPSQEVLTNLRTIVEAHPLAPWGGWGSIYTPSERARPSAPAPAAVSSDAAAEDEASALELGCVVGRDVASPRALYGSAAPENGFMIGSARCPL